ncbi:hydroxymethylglutaryl-CoA synthase [Micromonospora tulbaghiae]|uniref:hydroxymethylglutaryl-CoA synthase family protein n=1 Tax=Micromonospora tulbaghiae TaxID=479978 RepID=UPI0033E67256
MTAQRIGIEALNVYCGLAYLPVPALFEGRGLDPARMSNLMMDRRSIGLPFEDPVTNAVNAALPLVERLTDDERNRIELVVTSSESGIDYSKSITSYVHQHLGLSRDCRILEVKQACYAATAAAQLAVGYLASGLSPGAKALVIATDVALVDARAEYAEPATGHGAAAVLLSDDPRVLTIDVGAFGNHSYETMDTARPFPGFDIADVDRSLFAYLDCLTNSFAQYAAKVDGADFATTFDYLVMHTPFAGLVRAAHRKMMREFAPAAPVSVEADFAQRLVPSLVYPRIVGNLCSGSVYLGLCSLIDNAGYTDGARVGLYAYGSGCSAEFYSGVIGPQSRTELARMGIAERLAARQELTFADYVQLIKENQDKLTPEENRDVDVSRYADLIGRVPGRPRMLAWTGIRNYHRRYEWV